jgi:hypothetical protein
MTQPRETADEAVPAAPAIRDAHAAPAGKPSRRDRISALLPWAGLAASLGLWAYTLAGVQATRVATAGLGLVLVLGITFAVALALLIVSFCWAIGHRARWPVAGAHLLALVAVLHATPAIVYGTLRYSWSWKHVGVTDYIMHNGVDFHLGGVLGAYQGWPGFFSLNSFLTSGAGLQSALSYANWALVAADLLWLGPVILIARAFTRDRRMVWAAALLFELGNWVGQDYFSPQALAFFLYLTVIAVCLRWLASPRCQPEGAPEVPRATRYALLACLLPLMVAIASSHQLTPFMLIAALALLAVFRTLRPAIAPVAMAVAAAAGWLGYGALPWLKANSYQIFQGLGVPWANTSAHLVGQGAIPADQALVNWGARFLSVGIGLLALVGYWRMRRRADRPGRRSWRRIALLTIAAIPSAAANSYGGEIIFRVFLFALPYLAVAAAAAFFPSPEGQPAGTQPAAVQPAAVQPDSVQPDSVEPAGVGLVRRASASVALAVIAVALAAGYCLGNYGKEAMNYFTPGEVAASQWLYRTAPRGAKLVAANSDFPWAFKHYDWYTYTFLDTPPALGDAVRRAPVSTMVTLMDPGRTPASYLILTTSQAQEISLTGEWPPGVFARISEALLTSGVFRIVYHNADATILELTQ